MASRSHLDRPVVGIFTREDFERAWQPREARPREHIRGRWRRGFAKRLGLERMLPRAAKLRVWLTRE